MDRGMDECMDGWMDKRMDGWMDGLTDGWRDGERMDVWTDRWMAGYWSCNPMQLPIKSFQDCELVRSWHRSDQQMLVE